MPTGTNNSTFLDPDLSARCLNILHYNPYPPNQTMEIDGYYVVRSSIY